ncbi:MAG TPA: Uma2 family endonuclease [Gemmatirosa sp.]
MATAVITERLTASEYYDSPDVPDRAELVHGKVHVMAPGANAHTLVCRTIFLALHQHAAARGLGEVFPDGFGYELPPRNDTVRIPDASFVRAGRLPATFGPKGCVRLAPDLAVEVLSPSDTYGVMRLKLADYREAGVRLVWLVDVGDRTAEVHTPDGAMRVVADDGILDGGDVLPGFSLPLRDLFVGVAAA